MLQFIPSESRFAADHGWLHSRFSFSFAEYQDPANTRFGMMRVFNDDIVQPGSGFGMHPHADMEIVTYVIDGKLEHKDSLGNKGVIESGEVQRMTAGSGIYHSEYNPSADTPVRLLQMWVYPKHKDLTPSWEQKRFTREEQRGKLLPVISGGGAEGALHIHQDASFYLTTLQAGETVRHTPDGNRRLLLFVIKGTASAAVADTSLEGGGLTQPLKEGDALRLTNASELAVGTDAAAELLLVDLA